MKAELRIGNLVSRKDLGNGEDRIETIIELRETKAVTSGPIKVVCEYQNLKPIPITEEWLLKFGFEKIESYNGYENPYVKIDHPEYKKSGFAIEFSAGLFRTVYLVWEQDASNFSTPYIGDFLNYEAREVDIKYVNQLQNLYFSLTGTELEIKQ